MQIESEIFECVETSHSLLESINERLPFQGNLEDQNRRSESEDSHPTFRRLFRCEKLGHSPSFLGLNGFHQVDTLPGAKVDARDC